MTKNNVIILGVVVVFGIWWWGVPTYRKARAEARIHELCAKDGVTRIFETVPTPVTRFDQFGEVRVPHERYRKSDDEFYYSWQVVGLRLRF